MITVGYGDISPINCTEKIYVIIMTLFSCGTFGYALNCIGSIFSELAANHAEFKLFIFFYLFIKKKQTNNRIMKFEISNYLRNRDIDENL
jgi:hypothetical protein